MPRVRDLRCVFITAFSQRGGVCATGMHSLATTGQLDAPANGMAFGAAIEGDWRPSLLPRGPVLVVPLTLVGGVRLSQDAAARTAPNRGMWMCWWDIAHHRPGWPYSVWHESQCAQVGHGVFGDGRLRGEDFYGMEVTAEPLLAPPPHGLHDGMKPGIGRNRCFEHHPDPPFFEFLVLAS